MTEGQNSQREKGFSQQEPFVTESSAQPRHWQDVIRDREEALRGLENGNVGMTSTYFRDFKACIEADLKLVIEREEHHEPAGVEETWMMQDTQAMIANYLEDSDKSEGLGYAQEKLDVKMIEKALLYFPGVTVTVKDGGYSHTTHSSQVCIKVFNNRLRERGIINLYAVGEGREPI